jgi:hypothetical protein
MKKAQVQGMCSSANKIAVKSIIAQINKVWKNEEIYKLIYGEEKYMSFIASFLCQLPGHQSSGAEGAASALTQSTTGVKGLKNNPSNNDDDDMDMNSKDELYFYLVSGNGWINGGREVGRTQVLTVVINCNKKASIENNA